MAAIFWFVTEDEPMLKARRRESGAKPDSFLKQLEPLKNMQVWRFSLYYFCVFGAFVALALWLPRYLVGAYGFDIKSAGMLAASYSIFASLFRALGGWLSDRYGARLIDVLDVYCRRHLYIFSVLSAYGLYCSRH